MTLQSKNYTVQPTYKPSGNTSKTKWNRANLQRHSTQQLTIQNKKQTTKTCRKNPTRNANFLQIFLLSNTENKIQN